MVPNHIGLNWLIPCYPPREEPAQKEERSASIPCHKFQKHPLALQFCAAVLGPRFAPKMFCFYHEVQHVKNTFENRFSIPLRFTLKWFIFGVHFSFKFQCRWYKAIRNFKDELFELEFNSYFPPQEIKEKLQKQGENAQNLLLNKTMGQLTGQGSEDGQGNNGMIGSTLVNICVIVGFALFAYTVKCVLKTVDHS